MKAIACSPLNCLLKKSPYIQDNLASPNDTVVESLDKIKKGIANNDNFIMWRIIFIGSTISFIILWFIIIGKFPSERNLVIGVAIITIVFYIIEYFYYFHVHKPINDNMEINLSNLEKLCFYQNNNQNNQ